MGSNIKPRKRQAQSSPPIRFDYVMVGNIMLGYWPDDAPGLLISAGDKGCELSEEGVEKLIAHLQQWLNTKMLPIPKTEAIAYAI